MSKIEKIGKPSIKDSESGANIELGQPVFNNEFEKESVEATFPVIKEALDEFYTRRASHDKQAAFSLQVMRNAERPYTLATWELAKERGVTLALAIIESARGELQYEISAIESYELESENSVENQNVETKRQKNFEQDLHYQEAADILFNHAEYGAPEKSDFIEWLGKTKELIKKLAKKEEEKLSDAESDEENGGVINNRIFRSRLLTDVPAIERFETGRETTRDYREIMDMINSRLLAEREHLGTLLLQYANDSKAGFYDEMTKTIAEVRQMELFLAIAEGERNERVAKNQS